MSPLRASGLTSWSSHMLLCIFEYPHRTVGLASDLICYMLGTVYHSSFNAITVCDQNGLLLVFMCYFMHLLFLWPCCPGVWRLSRLSS